MRRSILIALICLAPAFAYLQSDGDFKISTDVFVVLLDVGVKDSKGGYVADLKKDDFRVEENGVPQTITSFSHGDAPVTVGLVMDDSGSMIPKRSDLIAAGLEFANDSNRNDEMFVINFNDKVRFGLPPGVPFSGNIRMLDQALSKDPAAGRTTLYDAIIAGLEHLTKGTRDRKALIVVSDGGDNASKHKLPEVMKMIEQSHATIYTIGLFDEDDPYQRPQILQKMSSVSGGESFLPQKYSEVIPICRRIAEDIRNRYTIGYVPARGNGKGGVRNIKVTATAPHHGRLIVQTRTTYIEPPEK